MNPLAALFFPHSILRETTIQQLLLVFERLFYYQPVEGDAPEKLKKLRDAGLLTGYAPVPLGEDLPRFARLIKDLKGHEDEFYSGYLMSLNRNDKIAVDESSVLSLIARITNKNVEDEEDRVQQENLWRARLLLKLAEILAREEQEINKSLAGISGKESDMMRFLKGEEEKEIDDPFHFTRLQFAETTPTSPGKNLQLFKAWAQLYMCDTQAPPWILTTDEPDIVEVLIDVYEECMKEKAVFLFALPLTREAGMNRSTADKAFFPDLREELRNKAAGCLEKIHHLLWDAATSTGTAKERSTIQEDLHNEMDVWKNSMQIKDVPETTLKFYLFPGMDLSELISRAGRLEVKGPSGRPFPPHAIIALYN